MNYNEFYFMKTPALNARECAPVNKVHAIGHLAFLNGCQ